MIKAKGGEFFFLNWLRNRNSIEFLGVWEKVNSPWAARLGKITFFAFFSKKNVHGRFFLLIRV